MTQLEKLRLLLNVPAEENDLLELYLEFAKDIICDIRDSSDVEPQYLNVQVKIAAELYNKNGAEGQVSHDENGVSRNYGKSEVSDGLLQQITPFIKTPYSTRRVVNDASTT